VARAVVITRPGGREVLAVADRPVRAPGPGEVRIAVRAAAVNPTDTFLREHGTEGEPPWIPGMDAAGVIESIAGGERRLSVGDRVMAAVTPRRPEGGAQIELLVAPATSVVAIPDGATLEQASTLPMNGLTAEVALDLLSLGSGQTLAVSGGAGLLASYAIPLAKTRGLRVIADAKPGADTELVHSFGADVVVARGDGFVAGVRDAAADGADALLDTAVLGRAALGAIRDGGAIAAVRGWRGGEPERGIRVADVRVSPNLDRTDWLDELRQLASDGRIQLRVAAEYPPEAAAEAERTMEAGGLRGRAVIVF
jgi:NADPH:quinone reductase